MKQLELERERKWVKGNETKEVAFKDQPNIVRPEMVRPATALQAMDTSLEGFFRKREFNTSNFNLLLLGLNEKKDLQASMVTLERMEALGVATDARTYDILISTCAKVQDIEAAEKVFKTATDKYGKSLALYNGLASAYGKKRRFDDLLKIMTEMESQGIEPNRAFYTTAIQGAKYAQDYPKCFELYEKMLKTGRKPDEVLATLMMQVCSYTDNCEKAKKIFELAKPEGSYYKTCYPYNALIKALACREDYAVEGEATFQQMINYQIEPDSDSIVAVLKATSATGNVKTAFNALQLMKERNLPMNRYVYTGLINTYAAACKQVGLAPELMTEYKKDAWTLFKQAEEKGMVNGYTVDSLMLVHVNARDMDTVEGAILPIYENKQLLMNSNTYEILLKGYDNTMELPKIVRIYEKIKDNIALMNTNSMNIILQTFIRLKDQDNVEVMLGQFLEYQRRPKALLLHSLGNSMNISENLYVLLHKFDKKYGIIKSRRFKVKTHVEPYYPYGEIPRARSKAAIRMNKRHPGLWKSLYGEPKIKERNRTYTPNPYLRK